FVDEKLFDENALKEILSRYCITSSYKVSRLEEKNWNEEWEKNFQPVFIADTCAIKASFHKLDKTYPYEIIINPKMSFGTGHHETTSMMIENQLETDHKNKKVMDAGSGTGILAIMASKLGAEQVFAFDTEDWAFENLKENINLNACRNVKVAKGDISGVSVPFSSFDIILANINKNVLLDEIPVYSKYLSKGGILIVSGFYEEDISDIDTVCRNSSLKKISHRLKNRWASLVFQK
ncbi:MAG: 50S ribosomal protein L11 methyltransferase, partial [Cytophagaceae bacterium]|nr:50S ribosomal protein L11 methyltransferase [Cytophagaceae bacterium]